MARLPIVGGDLDAWATILNNYLLVTHNADGTLKDDVIDSSNIDATDAANIRTLLDIVSSGAITAEIAAAVDDLSGVTDAATARSNLSVYSQAQVYTQSAVDAIVANYLLLNGGVMTGKITLDGAPTADLHAASKKYVDDNLVSTEKHELFTASGTFTVPLGVTQVFITAVGGGGGGGGSQATSNTGGGGGGGGRGGILMPYTVTPLAELTVIIGAAGIAGGIGTGGGNGGNTVFDGLTFNGGTGGGFAGGAGGSSNGLISGSGGAGSTGSSGGQSLYYSGGTAGGSDGGGGGGGSMYGKGGNAGASGANGASASVNGGAGGGGGGIGEKNGGTGGSGQLIVSW